MPVAILFVIIANHFGFCPSERLKSIRKNSAKKIKIAVLYINSAFPLGSRSAIKNSHERKRYPPTAKKTVKKNGRKNFIFYSLNLCGILSIIYGVFQALSRKYGQENLWHSLTSSD